MTDVYTETAPPHLSEYGIEFFSQTKDNAGVIARAHIHPAIEFIYITKGTFEIGIDSEQLTATVGDLVLFRANAVHTTRHVGEGYGEYFVLKINPTLLFQIFLGKDITGYVIPFLHRNPGDISHFAASDIPIEAKRILDSMIDEYDHSDKYFFAIERAYAAAFLVSLLRTVIKPQSYLQGGEISEKSVGLIYESVKYVNENYASDITPTDCAESIHLSYSYFAKLFRAVTGKTFKEYLTGVRLAKAHNVLISTALPITDVAASCGYSNLSYFIAEYRKVYGRTPRETRKDTKKPTTLKLPDSGNEVNKI
ncbi:MAG: AraC family transcriptional regulator [Clostridia bacterium]|nr:AraC family transcriptional regulator [Clostridia bacterium]